MSYKRFYLTGGLSILGLFLLIAPFIEYYYDYQEITYCNERCWVEFCMKNGATNLYFYNKEQLPLTFSPKTEIKSVEFFKKDSRFKSGYRQIDFIKPYSEGVQYVFKIDAFKTSCYGMEIIKEAKANVKWTFIGLDPWLISTPQGNLTYDVNSCYNLTSTKDSLGNCFAANWSIAYSQVNFSNNRTMQSGNYSWNFTQRDIVNSGDWLFNFTNNGTTNITIKIKLNETKPERWQLFYTDATGDNECYQENANNTTPCNSNIGNYSLDGWPSDYLWVDGLWGDSRGGSSPGENRNLYANWSKPINYSEFTGASFKYGIWISGINYINNTYPLSESCYYSHKTLVRMRYKLQNSNLVIYCYNNTGWEIMQNTTADEFVDDEMIWRTSANITSTSFISFLNLQNGTSQKVNFTLNVYNLSQTYVNWTLNQSNADWSFNYTLNITSY